MEIHRTHSSLHPHTWISPFNSWSEVILVCCSLIVGAVFYLHFERPLIIYETDRNKWQTNEIMHRKKNRVVRGSDTRVLAYFTVRATQSRFSFKLSDTQPFNTSKTPGDRSHILYRQFGVVWASVVVVLRCKCMWVRLVQGTREKENEQLHTTDAMEIFCSAVRTCVCVCVCATGWMEREVAITWM